MSTIVYIFRRFLNNNIIFLRLELFCVILFSWDEVLFQKYLFILRMSTFSLNYVVTDSLKENVVFHVFAQLFTLLSLHDNKFLWQTIFGLLHVLFPFIFFDGVFHVVNISLMHRLCIFHSFIKGICFFHLKRISCDISVLIQVKQASTESYNSKYEHQEIKKLKDHGNLYRNAKSIG